VKTTGRILEVPVGPELVGRSKQWAYRGRPLYRWKQDRKPGDAGGDGIGGMWHVARP
ncbi:hypothetical protein ACTJLD_10810, partial [Burkholderia sp. 22088]